jgi:hypothetical protein
MPWPGSTGADNAPADLRTSRVPSEYKRVVGASFLKYVIGLESTINTQPITKQTRKTFSIDTLLIKMDSIVTAVIEKFKQRSEFGQAKYGTNLDRKDLSVLQWIVHAQEEHMDAILYLEKLKTELARTLPITTPTSDLPDALGR